MFIVKFLLVLLFLNSFTVSSQVPDLSVLGVDSPESVPLGGSLREDVFNSPIGSIKLRWTREVESKFGRSPLRATIEASNAISRVLRLQVVPSSYQNPSFNLNIAFMDKINDSAKFPRYLIESCHPGWMIPPSYVYIVSERIYSACGSSDLESNVADDILARVIVHELAHVLEFEIIGISAIWDKARKEGFARWFELYAARHSTLLNEESIREEIFSNALLSFKMRDAERFRFDGSGMSYDRVAAYFSWIENRYGLAEVFKVYDDIRDKELGFFQILEKRYFLSPNALEKEVIRYLKSKVK